MKTVPIHELQNVNFALTDISVTYRTPPWTTLGDLHNNRRTVNGFLLIDQGSCHYEWLGGNTDLVSGSLIYLPIGSIKLLTVTQRPFSYYNINFTVTDISSSEQIIFDKNPVVISHSVSRKIFECCKIMLSSTMSRNGIYLSTSNLFEIFETILKYHTEKTDSRIATAVEYIENNYTESTDIEYLSNLCYMSQAHFFRLFKAEKGVSPIEYRNNLRIERAKSLLSENEYTISEIATLLGFDSVYYFSRFFKKSVGIPPSEYTSFKI